LTHSYKSNGPDGISARILKFSPDSKISLYNDHTDYAYVQNDIDGLKY